MKSISHFIKSLLKAEGGTNSVNRKCNPLRRSCVSRERNAGESAICPVRAQPSAEIARVECAKCRRECDLSLRAQPSAEIVRVECAKCRRECDLSGARATLCGDRAGRAREMQARVRFVPCARNPLRRSCVSSARICGDRAGRAREMQARVRLVRCARNHLRRSCVSSARNADERAYLGSWKLRTGDLVVQLEYAEYLGSWKMRTGDFVVQL